MYARYLYHENDLRKAGIIKELNNFMENNYPHYNPIDWSASLEKYANKAGKYPLCECKGVWTLFRSGQAHRECRSARI